MRWIGAALILGSGIWMAAALSRSLTARCQEMAEMRAGWTRLGDRVGIYADRLSEAAALAAAATDGTVKKVFEAFAVRLDEPFIEDPDKAWKWAMDAYRGMLHMSREEIIGIRELGQCIGETSMEEQRRGFVDILGRLEKWTERAQKAKKEGTALWTRWCFLIAAAAAIAVL
jgi:stage III sporulation protein AB